MKTSTFSSPLGVRAEARVIQPSIRGSFLMLIQPLMLYPRGNFRHTRMIALAGVCEGTSSTAHTKGEIEHTQFGAGIHSGEDHRSPV